MPFSPGPNDLNAVNLNACAMLVTMHCISRGAVSRGITDVLRWSVALLSAPTILQTG